MNPSHPHLARTVAALALLLAAPGCAAFFNGDREATSVPERHPITVDQQTASMSIPIDPSRYGLSRDQLRAIDGFVTEFRTRGHGPITVTAPSGLENDIDGQQTAADVRDALAAFGIDYRDMQGATYRTTSPQSSVILTFTRYVAAGPVCGVFTGEASERLRNRPAPNFGCADQQNLAAMVADPRDLTVAQPSAPANGTAAAAAARALSTGQNTWGGEGAFADPLSSE